MAKDFEAILNEYAVAVIERAQSNLRIKRKVRGKVANRVASGFLLKSLYYYIKITPTKPEIQFTVSNDQAGQYADVIEDGRTPGAKMPPPKAIEKWIKIKNLKLRNRQGEFIKSTESNIKSAAFAIAKSIGKNGIVGINYYKEAIDDTWEEYKDVLIEGYVNGIEQRLLLNKR